MYIIEKPSEVRLFLVGQSGAPFEGTGGVLAYPSLPLYALLRVGDITTPLGHEYALGLQRSPWLQPIYIVHMPHLLIEYEDAVREACSNDTKIKELRGLFLSRTYFERCLETDVDGEQQRIAALIPLDDLKEINIPARCGFGVFLGLEDIKHLAEKQRVEALRRDESLRTSGVIKLTIPTVSVSALGLNIAFLADPDDLSFLIRAMERWDKRSHEERREKWEKFQQTVVGTSI